MMKSSSGGFVLLVAIAAMPRTAAAVETAEAHLNNGVQLLGLNKDAEALEEFRAAYAIAPTPLAVVQMGLAETSLKRWVDAEKHLAEGLAEVDDQWVQSNRQPVEEELAKVRSHLGWLYLVGTPQTQVLVDGVVVGFLPLASPRVRRPEGMVRVEGRLTGHLTIVKEIRIIGTAEHTVRLEFPLQPPPPAGNLALVAPQPSPALVVAGATEESTARPVGYQTLPWLSLGIGVIALIDAQMLDNARHPCDGSGQCGPSNAVMIGTAVTGGLAIGIGLDALAIKLGWNLDPRIVKPIVLSASALAGAGAVVSGALLVHNKGYGSATREAFGGASLAAGGITLLLDALILFERTPEPNGRRIAIAPTPGGLAVFGAF